MTDIANNVAAADTANVVKIARVRKAKAPAVAVVASNRFERDRIYRVSPLSIVIEEGYNVEGRTFDSATSAKDAELLKSIQHGGGIKTPLTVRQDADGTLYVVAGHRRLGAALELLSIGKGRDVTTIPVMLATLRDNDKRQYRDADLFTSNSGVNLTPIQQAMVAQRLISQGFTVEAIANLGGFTTKYARILVGVGHLPQVLQDHMLAGRVPMNTVTEMVGKYDADNKATAPVTLDIITRAIDAKHLKVGFGSDIVLKGKDIAPFLPAAVADDVAPDTTDDTVTDDAPVADVKPVKVKPEVASALTVSGARVLKDGKTLCTFSGADAEQCKARASAALAALKAIEHLL